MFLGNISIWTANWRFSIIFLEWEENCRQTRKKQSKSSKTKHREGTYVPPPHLVVKKSIARCAWVKLSTRTDNHEQNLQAFSFSRFDLRLCCRGYRYLFLSFSHNISLFHTPFVLTPIFSFSSLRCGSEQLPQGASFSVVLQWKLASSQETLYNRPCIVGWKTAPHCTCNNRGGILGGPWLHIKHCMVV